jgi:hypothetical protein
MTIMAKTCNSQSPTIMLRISDGTFQTHRSFSDFSKAIGSAEAFAAAGFAVAMMSATGRFLMSFEPRRQRLAI